MSHSALMDAAAALSTFMDLNKGRLAVCTETQRWRISDMPGVFADEEKRADAQAASNNVVYEVFRTEPEGLAAGAVLCYSTTVVHHGRIGDEYYMTEGHTHADGDASEVHLTVRGQGMMLLQTRDHQVQALAMAPGTVLYVPGGMAHRLVNIGQEPLVSFAVYPRAADETFEPMPAEGFKRIIVATDEGPDLVLNLRFDPNVNESPQV